MFKTFVSFIICLILFHTASAEIPVNIRSNQTQTPANRLNISFDHGNNWSDITLPCTSHILGACFLSADSGFVFGARGECFFTNDMGATFIERPTFVDNNLHGGAFRDIKHGFLCGSDGIILKTDDGGLSWEIVSELLGVTLFDIANIDSSNLVCVGQGGVVLRSNDNGVTWIEASVLNDTVNENLYQIDTQDSDRLVIEGFGNAELESRDNGISWRRCDTIIHQDANQSDEQHDSNNSLSQRFIQEIQAMLGKPYKGFCLGEGESGLFDRDPRWDFNRVDCVTMVEQALAKALSKNYGTVLGNLDHIRYKGGRVGFLSRNHFFAAEWIQSNSWILEDVTGNTGGKTVENLTRTVDRQKFLKLVVADATIPEYDNFIDYTISYIPRVAMQSVSDKITKPLIVSFIGKEPDWLFSTHVGVVNREADGKLYLYHASSERGMVVRVEFLSYIQQHKRIVGVKLLQLSA